MPQRIAQIAKTLLPALIVLTLANCGGDSPSAPTPAPSAAKAVVAVSSIDVTGSRAGAGYEYRLTVNLREQGGLGATMSALEISFLKDGTAVGRATITDPFTVTRVGANSALASRRILVTDENGGDFATTREVPARRLAQQTSPHCLPPRRRHRPRPRCGCSEGSRPQPQTKRSKVQRSASSTAPTLTAEL